jgi:RNA polymerase sigma factor (sigma-70 family)
VIDVLKLWLSRRGLDAGDLEEVCADAVVRLIDGVRADRLDPARPAGAWLRVVADHLAIDAQRRRRRNVGVAFDEGRHGAVDEDERLSMLLDRAAAKEEIRSALREAARDEQPDVVSVVTTWLALTRANGGEASSREVAERLGVSHMTVQRGLAKFSRRLPRR